MRTEDRPWGRFEVLHEDADTWLKRLYIAPGQSLSLQRHLHRIELWWTLDEGVQAVIGAGVQELQPKQVYTIPAQWKHRLINPCEHEVCVIEWALGEPTEFDIERYQDNYGR